MKRNMRLLVTALLLSASQGQAATFYVTNASDAPTPGPVGSLRRAISDANAYPGTDDIYIMPGFSPIEIGVLGADELVLSTPVNIYGPGTDLLTIRPISMVALRLFRVAPGTAALISDLTLSGGIAAGRSGGGIFNEGTLTLERVAVLDCRATGTGAELSGYGGGIGNQGSITMTDCTLSGNRSEQDGGGISNNLFASLIATRCTITGNGSYLHSAGGLNNRLSTATLTNCTISDNTAFETGGAIRNAGAFGTDASLTLTSCTIADNNAQSVTGGIEIVANGANSTVTLHNTLVANNTSAGLNRRNFRFAFPGAVLVSNGYNFDSDGTSGWTNGVGGNIVGNGFVPINAQLAPLASNGGWTQTRRLLPGSPAIDRGAPAGFPSQDQRLLGRPVDGDGNAIARADIGAYEATRDCNGNNVPDPDDIANNTSADCNGNNVPDSCEVTAGEAWVFQWANSVIGFSSEYSGGAWSAAQATGVPDTFGYGDIGTAWAPGPVNGTLEFITLGFGWPVYADGVTIRETWGNGMVYQVDVVDTSGTLHPVWTGVDPSLPGAPVDFEVSWPVTSYLVKGVKIYTNTDHDPSAWEEIDAVRIHGRMLVEDCNDNMIPDTCEPDVDGDLVPDVCDLCADTIPDSPVDANGCPPLISGDFDRDGDVDTTDVDAFKACATRSAVPRPPGCAAKDFDADNDCDLNDFGVVQRCYSGANVVGNPNCAP